jgi:putative phosphoesterase
MSTSRRIAALYDIHGNLPALEATLAAIDAAGIDEIIVGGDIVLGPMPGETLNALLALGDRVRFLNGNCDRLVVEAFDGRPAAHLPEPVRKSINWTAQQLDRVQRDFLAALPLTLEADVAQLGTVLFCHATPRNDSEIFTKLTPEETVRPMIAGVTQQIMVCGHTHMQFDRVVDDVRLLNAGSVGMPFGRPGAHWLTLGPDVRAEFTPYNLEETAELVRRTSFPGAEEFASRNVLNPSSEEDGLRMFEPKVRAP